MAADCGNDMASGKSLLFLQSLAGEQSGNAVE